MISALLATRLSHETSSFCQDAPRPPVPGQEGQHHHHSSQSAPPAGRRNEDGLGEPEGSASPDSPLARWNKSLHCLLADQDGAHLFRTFLEREKCVDTLDFWFACNGFRQMDIKDPKTLRVAKAIHKRYIENCGIVSKQLQTPSKVCIRDSIKKQRIASTMFDQAQAEIQARMEDNAYHMFLTSDLYLQYVSTGGENSAYYNSMPPASLKLLSAYLPTLNEEEELTCVHLEAKGSPSVVALSSKSLRATATCRAKEAMEHCYGAYKTSDPVNPYHVTSGFVFAPAASTNESEVSSDAMTDDSMSMTDSSVDGVPPYRSGSKKRLQREMHRSVRANGQVVLPPFPRTHRPPREMTPIVPAVFAAQLITRLEKVKQEQETIDTLEERLQRIKEEEEREECESGGVGLQPPQNACVASQQAQALVSCGPCEEDPQAILDEHLSRVLKTPGCQSPGIGRSRSPDATLCAPCPLLTKSFVTKHIHHHYIHHHSKEEAEPSRTLHGICSASSCWCMRNRTHAKAGDLALLHVDNTGSRGGTLPRKHCRTVSEYSVEGIDGATIVYRLPATWQRVVESETERQCKHRSHSAQSSKRSAAPGDTPRSSSAERPARHHQWLSGLAHPRPSSHPLVQDLALASPSTLAQLEEACRRLAEVSRPSKHRCPSSGHQRSHSVPSQPGASTPQHEDQKEAKRQPGELTVTYFFCGEEIPYRRVLKSHSLTLAHFKEQLSKKGNYRYYFKKASQEFECGAVFEEIGEDDTILPTYEGRVLGKVERIN